MLSSDHISNDCHDQDVDPGAEIVVGRGGDVVSEPGVTEVNAVSSAPDTHPGHTVSAHSSWQHELHILT